MSMEASMQTATPFQMQVLVSKVSTPGMVDTERAGLREFHITKQAATGQTKNISNASSSSVNHTQKVLKKLVGPKSSEPINATNPPRTLKAQLSGATDLPDLNYTPGSTGKNWAKTEPELVTILGDEDSPLFTPSTTSTLGKSRADAFQQAYNGKLSYSFELMIKDLNA